MIQYEGCRSSDKQTFSSTSRKILKTKYLLRTTRRTTQKCYTMKAFPLFVSLIRCGLPNTSARMMSPKVSVCNTCATSTSSMNSRMNTNSNIFVKGRHMQPCMIRSCFGGSTHSSIARCRSCTQEKIRTKSCSNCRKKSHSFIASDSGSTEARSSRMSRRRMRVISNGYSPSTMIRRS